MRDKNRKEVLNGEIWWVEFDPSIGHEFKGRRPALIIQADKQIEKSNLITVMPLTENLNNKMGDDILVKASVENQLLADSVLKVYDIASFDYLRFIKNIGRANVEVMDKVKNYLKKHFGI